jgi:hypothetical protein
MVLSNQLDKSIHTIENNSVQAMKFSIELSKQVLLYMLFRYQKLLLCMVTLSVSSSFDLVSDNAKELTDFTNKNLQGIQSGLDKSLSGLNSVLANINAQVPKINVLGHSLDLGISKLIPIKFGEVENQLNWTLPKGTQSTLEELGKVDISLDRIHQEIAKIVSIPFDKLKTDMDSIVGNVDFGFQKIVLPEPMQRVLFCDDVVPVSVIDKIVDGAQKGVLYLAAGVAFSILVILLVMAKLTQLFHGFEQDSFQDVTQELQQRELSANSQSQGRTMALSRFIYVALKHPLVYWFSKRISMFRNENGNCLQWFLVYISHPIAWMCIAIGTFGIIIIKLQLVILGWIFTSMTNVIEQELKASMENASGVISLAVQVTTKPFVDTINSSIETIEKEFQNLIIGNITDVLKTIATGVDKIFSSFQDELHDTLKIIPPIDHAITSFYTCVVGNITETLSTIDKQLQEHAKISFTRITSDDFGMNSNSLLDTMNLSQQIHGLKESTAANANLLFDDQIEKLKEGYVEMINFQCIPFYIILGFGLSLVVFGIVAVAYQSIMGKETRSSNDYA